MNQPNNKLFQHGHIEIGYTLALWIILAGLAAMHYVSDGEPLDMWHSWPWWAKLASVITPVILFYLGGAFESSRAWPKLTLEDLEAIGEENEKKEGDEVMNDIKRPVNQHKAYHAHVYFDESSAAMAKALCEEAGDKFGLRVGRFHEKLVGPHTRWSCQITFGTRDFEQFVPWLDDNRQHLSILVHALTGDDLQDHTEFAYWLGDPIELDLSLFSKS